jgi:hypothetical protein
METRVYAIKETENVHEISNEDFMQEAEDMGYVWSLLGFQNILNIEGNQTKSDDKVRTRFFSYLHFRFIDVPTSEKDYANKCCVKNEDNLEWFRKFANYISNNANDVYNDASKFADCNCGDGSGVEKEHCDCDEESDTDSNNDDVYTLQCDKEDDSDEADTYGLKNKCFCDGCGEYVETSECIMNDYTENVDGIEVDVSEVLCNTCNENKDKTPSIASINNALDIADKIRKDVFKKDDTPDLKKNDEPKCTKCGSEFEEVIWKTDGLEYEDYICSNNKCCSVHSINIERGDEEDGEVDIDRDWGTLEFSYIWEQGLKNNKLEDQKS